ncbi:aspartic proteinase nepenthesin-1 [Citrus clementina]|uniref:aspartic proteinase nepenthesin-1 n=1 Tax=Citrus clementina TaxID=85681 RepID=UPI000CED3525|nr:aspartic proteinase nepenthesin-1 [Citrus x clementina]
MDDWKPFPDGILPEEITTSDDERVVYICFREASEVRTIERWEVEHCCRLCSYDWKYKEGSGTKGVLSSESFTFPGDKNTSLTFANVTFGCGYDNQNVSFGGYMGSDNIIAGVFGLGAGQRSILRQLEPETNLHFSYCLRLYPTTDGSNTTYLRFGPDAQIKGDNKRKVQTIKLNPSLPGYFVNVTGISVEGKRLEIDPALFQLKQGGSGGFAIDSGVGPTLLVPEAYEVLKLEILEFYLARGFHPVKVLHVPYDLCYAITPAANADASVFFPSMVIHFEGADLFLDDTAVMGFVAPQLFCLIFLPTHPSGPNLLGAFQQENQRFLFDVGKSTVSFVSETCNEQE